MVQHPATAQRRWGRGPPDNGALQTRDHGERHLPSLLHHSFHDNSCILQYGAHPTHRLNHGPAKKKKISFPLFFISRECKPVVALPRFFQPLARSRLGACWKCKPFLPFESTGSRGVGWTTDFVLSRRARRDWWGPVSVTVQWRAPFQLGTTLEVPPRTPLSALVPHATSAPRSYFSAQPEWARFSQAHTRSRSN